MTRTIPEHARASARSDFPSGTAKRDLCSDVITYISEKLFSFRHARFGQFGTLFSAFSPCLSRLKEFAHIPQIVLGSLGCDCDSFSRKVHCHRDIASYVGSRALGLQICLLR